ncbi:SCO family protein [Acidiphilium sp.]|uniref:SCO family protein n=1 Tax=Acidiphilium sp. TaxID=527 RepID=UPI00258B05DC|nr:SCO family protein [Acidiphilium sp.]
MTDRSDNSAIQPRQGRRLARRVAIGGAIGFGALLTVIVIDPGVAGITERGSLALLARLLGWKKPGNRPATTTDSAIPPGAPIGGPFTLINQDGQTMTRASFRGRWMLVYLGYTRCPDECPLTMEKLAIMMKALGPQSRRVAPVFVTVDPIHDTPPVLKAYLAKFSNQITGLVAS